MSDRRGDPAAGPVLILTPTGRDAEGAAKLLAGEGIDSRICRTLSDLYAQLDPTAGIVLLADEAIIRQDLTALTARIRAQPPWSDMPFVVLTQAGLTARRQMAELDLPTKLGNMLVLERPLNAFSLISAVKTSLRARQRQRQVRDYLARQEGEADRVAAELEARVSERTAALEAAEAERAQIAGALAQSQKMEAVGQLTGGIAHDFNNMLTGITGSLSLVMTRLERGEIKQIPRYIQLAQDAARKAAALTHRLLAYSRQQTLDPKPTRINDLVEGMTELIRRTLGAEIAIETKLDDHLWLAWSDPHQLENALLNLCLNARDAITTHGTLLISTRNEHLSQEQAAGLNEFGAGDYVTLSVTDNGSGMPPHILDRVFEPFFTTKPIGEGTGLGLSMIYGFLRQSGGNIRIDSEVGRGTDVRLYLPRHHGADTPHMLEPATRPAQRAHVATVLVVDDEPTVRLIVCDSLADSGLTILEADSGKAALQILQQTPSVSLLVTDVAMPHMNGRQLAIAARQIIPALKVLFITGYEESASAQGDSPGPPIPVMTKPFELDALAGMVHAIILQH